MSGSPGSGGSNPRKFSEKIALHNQKQAEETRAFEQLMTDLTVSRVQYQQIQQLRLSQSRAPYYGSLPNVNQMVNASSDFQACFPAGLDSARGTRHHGLVERVQRNRLGSPHRRLMEKPGRQMENSPYGSLYLSPPPDNNWRREQPEWTEDRRHGYRLLSQLNRTSSDSALHTSVMNPVLQDPFSLSHQMGRGPPLRNASMNEVEGDGSADVFSFPPLPGEEGLLGVSKPLPKQLWEAQNVQSLNSRPKSCEVNVFASPEGGSGLLLYQGSLHSGGSLPDLSNLHFPSPLHTPLDPPEDGAPYRNLSGGSSTGNLPAAMTHLGLGHSQGLSSSLSNPSLQASLSNPSIHSALRLSSLSSAPQGGLSSSPRRRPPPISPLTLSPGAEPRRSPLSPNLSPIAQGITLDTSNLPMEPPPPYPLYQQSQHAVGRGQQQPTSPLQNLDFNSSPHNSMASFFSDPFIETHYSNHQAKDLPYQLDQFSLLENALYSAAGGPCFDPSSSSSLYYPSQQGMMGVAGHHGNMQDPHHTRSNMLFSSCSGVPNIILTDDNSAMSAAQECFGSEGGFPLEDELRIEPLTLDGLSMLSDPDMVLPDPSVEDSFRSDRL